MIRTFIQGFIAFKDAAVSFYSSGPARPECVEGQILVMLRHTQHDGKDFPMCQE
jgi:hypothetical protein